MVVGDVAVHKSEGLVKLERIQYMTRDGVEIAYYVFLPYFVRKNINTIMIPSFSMEERIRPVMDNDYANKIIESIKNFTLVSWDDNNKTRKQSFDAILASGDSLELSKMIYLIKRKEIELKGTKKSISKFDGDALQRAERILYGELAYILNVSIDDIDNYYSTLKGR